MNFNFPKFLNDAVEGVVFFIYRYVGAIYLTTRFPFRGPLVLGYWNVKNRADTLSPHVFALSNLVIGFFFVDIVAPFIFVGLSALAESLPAQFDRIQNSEIDYLPLLLRSVVMLISMDAALRLCSMGIRHRRKRSITRNCLLFAYGMQPLGIVVLIVYVMQYSLFSTKHEGFIAFSMLALAVVLALPAIILTVRMLGPLFRHWNEMKWSLGVSMTILASLFVLAAYAEAGVLVALGLGDPKTKIEITQLACRLGPGGSAELTAILENKTRSAIILPTQGLLLVFAGDEEVRLPQVETSLGPRPSALIMATRTPIWLRANVANGAKITSGDKCILDIRDSTTDAAFIVGRQVTNWR